MDSDRSTPSAVAPSLASSEGEARLRVPRSFAGVAWFILIVLALRVVYLAFLSPWPLVADEAQYWQWSRRLDWSYYTKGPGVAWVIWASTRLFGDREWAIRLPSAIASAILCVAGARLAFDVVPSGADRAARVRSAWYAVIALAIVPGFCTTAQLLTPDMFYSAAWLVTAWCAWRAMRATSAAGSLAAWIGVGAAIGVGFLFKYTALLIVPGLNAWLILNRGEFTPASRRRIAIGLLLALVAFCVVGSPVAIWNAQRGWPTIAHQLGRIGLPGGDEKVSWKWSPMWFLAFAGAQIGILAGAGVLLIDIALRRTRVSDIDASNAEPSRGGAPRRSRSPVRDKIGSLPGVRTVLSGAARWRTYARGQEGSPVDPVARSLLIWLAGPILLGYLALSIVKQLQGNWAIAGYTTLLVLAGAAMANAPRARTDALRAAWAWFVGVSLVVATFVLFAPWLLRLPGVSGIERVKRLDRHLGGMAPRVADAVQKQRDTFASPPLLICAGYQDASLIGYYLHDHPVTYVARHLQGGRPTPWDFFADTDLTAPALHGRDALLIGSNLGAWQQSLDFDRIEPLPGSGEYKMPSLFRATGYHGVRAAATQPTARPADADDSDD